VGVFIKSFVGGVKCVTLFDVAVVVVVVVLRLLEVLGYFGDGVGDLAGLGDGWEALEELEPEEVGEA
jgi:hypothetical protein